MNVIGIKKEYKAQKKWRKNNRLKYNNINKKHCKKYYENNKKKILAQKKNITN